MQRYDRNELDHAARSAGFVRDSFEKVLRITRILEYMNDQEFFKEHFLLKGGTAINLTIFNLPRLSVDIDMDFVPDCSREEMELNRRVASQCLQDYMQSEGYIPGEDSRISHSLDSFHYRYQNAAGNPDMIKIELNYSLRCHILPPDRRKILTDVFGESIEIQTLKPMEIFAAKANALMTRAAARDLYDFDNMIQSGMFQGREDLFRKCVVFYHSISSDEIKTSFDASALDRITMNKIRRDLLPMLHDRGKFELNSRKERTKDYLEGLLQLTENEKKYLDCFKQKIYRPQLLFEDEETIKRIEKHPMALWKCKADEL